MRFLTGFTGMREDFPAMQAYALKIEPNNLFTFSGHGVFGGEARDEVVITRDASGYAGQNAQDGVIGFHLPNSGFFALTVDNARAVRDLLDGVLAELDASGR